MRICYHPSDAVRRIHLRIDGSKATEMDTEKLDKRRRDLYAISLSIILYNLAMGRLNGDTPILFGAMTVGRPWALFVGAAILWLYFVWQFVLVSRGSIALFGKDVDKEIMLSRTFRAFTQRRLTIISDGLQKRFAEVERDSPGSTEVNRLQQQLNHLRTQMNPYTSFHLSAPGAWLRSFDPKNVGRSPGGYSDFGQLPTDLWEKAETEVQFDRVLRFRILIPAILRAAAREHTFFEAILPLAVAALAPLSAIARYAWHACCLPK